MSPHDSFSRRAFFASASSFLVSGLFANAASADPPAVLPIKERLRNDVADASLSLRFQGTAAKECQRWQETFANRLRELLGKHQPPLTWQTKVLATENLKDHRRETLLLTAHGHPPLPIYLLTPLPEMKERPLPAILAIHGHGAYGHHPVAGRDDLPGVAKAIESVNYDYGRQLVRRGYVVAVPCLTPFGDRLGKPDAYAKVDPCSDVFLRLMILGRVLMAENLRDCLWSIALLADHPRVDRKRLGCVGLSYGGRMTMLTAALEPRIQVAIISGALNVMQERVAQPYSCGAQIIPGLLQYGDVPEIASLIAPRPCLWEVGRQDQLIDPKWAEEALTRIGRAYKAFAAADRLQVDRFEGGHVWNGKVAIPLLDKILKDG